MEIQAFKYKMCGIQSIKPKNTWKYENTIRKKVGIQVLKKKIHGNTRKYMVIRGNTWQYREIHGNT